MGDLNLKKLPPIYFGCTKLEYNRANAEDDNLMTHPWVSVDGKYFAFLSGYNYENNVISRDLYISENGGDSSHIIIQNPKGLDLNDYSDVHVDPVTKNPHLFKDGMEIGDKETSIQWYQALCSDTAITAVKDEVSGPQNLEEALSYLDAPELNIRLEGYHYILGMVEKSTQSSDNLTVIKKMFSMVGFDYDEETGKISKGNTPPAHLKFSYTAEIQSSDLFNVTEILSNAKSAEVRAALRSIVSQKSNATNINLKNFIVDNYFKDDKLKSGEELGALLQIREGWNELLSTFSLYADKDVMAFENAMIDRAFSLRKRNIEFNDGATEFFRELTAFADFIMKIKDDVPDKVSLQMKTIENLMSRRIVGANEELYTFLQSIVISGSLDERIVRKAIHCMKDLPVENDKIDDAETLEYAGRMRALWGMGLRNLASHKHEVLIGFQNILFNRAFSLECEDQDNQKKLNHELALFTQFIMKLDADLPGIAGFQMKALDRITERNYSDTDMFDILSEIIEKGKPCFDAAGKILKMAGHLNIDETVKRNFRARVLVAMNTMPASPFSLSDLFIDLLKKYAVPENGLQALSDMMGKPLISDDLELIITEWPNINISANRAAVLDALYNSGIPADRVKKRLYRHEGLIDKMIATNGTSRREWAALGRVLNKYGFIDSIDTLFYEKFEAVKDDAVKSINYGSAVGAMKLVRAGDSLIDLFWSETAIANIEVRHAVIISLAELDSRNEGKGGRLLKLEKDAGHVAVRWAELYEECMKRVETDGVAYQVLKRRISTPK